MFVNFGNDITVLNASNNISLENLQRENLTDYPYPFTSIASGLFFQSDFLIATCLLK